MIEIKCTQDGFKLVPIEKIVPNPKNNNRHSIEQIQALKKLIKAHGFRTPLTISNRTGFLVAGHGRLEAAMALGMNELPCIYQDFANEAEEYQHMTADNEIARWAELDYQNVYDTLKEIPDINTELLGIEDFVLPEVIEPQCDEDEVPEVPEEPKTKLGDIYKLGNHRLMCGDSTSIDAVEKLMDGLNMDITFTSPPYNASKNGHLTGNVSGFDNKYKTHNDSMDDQDYLDLLNGFTGIAVKKSKYTFVNLQLLTHNRWALMQYQTNWSSMLKDILIWNKKQCPPNIVKGSFNTKWEYIFSFSEDNKTRGFPCDWRGKYPNVVETESNANNEFADDHKAGFPVAFPTWFLEKFEFAKNIYDPFCGTGTTLIASENLNRNCFGMEIDPSYCDIIVARWEKFTGKKAELINGN